jgi:hypothetical protein
MDAATYPALLSAGLQAPLPLPLAPTAAAAAPHLPTPPPAFAARCFRSSTGGAPPEPSDASQLPTRTSLGSTTSGEDAAAVATAPGACARDCPYDPCAMRAAAWAASSPSLLPAAAAAPAAAPAAASAAPLCAAAKAGLMSPACACPSCWAAARRFAEAAAVHARRCRWSAAAAAAAAPPPLAGTTPGDVRDSDSTSDSAAPSAFAAGLQGSPARQPAPRASGDGGAASPDRDDGPPAQTEAEAARPGPGPWRGAQRPFGGYPYPPWPYSPYPAVYNRGYAYGGYAPYPVRGRWYSYGMPAAEAVASGVWAPLPLPQSPWQQQVQQAQGYEPWAGAAVPPGAAWPLPPRRRSDAAAAAAAAAAVLLRTRSGRDWCPQPMVSSVHSVTGSPPAPLAAASSHGGSPPLSNRSSGEMRGMASQLGGLSLQRV